jgi:16S rRNA (guanine527-N7)-methyltransferase
MVIVGRDLAAVGEWKGLRMEQSPSTSLAEALQRQAIELPAGQTAKIEQYCGVLWRWNDRLNLTRHTDFDTFVSRDVVDTLQLSALLDTGEDILDVGSGGGVPGLLLAILRPDLEISLSDGVGKKAKALDAMVAELSLSIPVYQCRAEALLDDFRFAALTARAVGPLWKICSWFQPHWVSIGRLLLIKGPRWVEERREARERGLLSGIELRKVATYPMSGTHSESVILQLRHQ